MCLFPGICNVLLCKCTQCHVLDCCPWLCSETMLTVCAATMPLCVQVPSFDNKVAMTMIEQELGRPWQEVYSQLTPRPIAAASLGQVRLQSCTTSFCCLESHGKSLSFYSCIMFRNDQGLPDPNHACMTWTKVFRLKPVVQSVVCHTLL